jgi:lipopolysaccharide transport system ATP-binding protein
MDDDVAIKMENVSKKYCKSLRRSMLYGIKDIARNMFGLSSHSGNLRKGEFWAVDDVSFEVKKGETLGIIGPNGSGKTTLLKMLNGIFWPDKGKITVKGKVGALIEVGAGFHPLLTGRENIYINAAILGMTRKEVDAKFDDIVKFADIGDFLDVPVKSYSSGMFVRLGFAVAVHCEPEILLIDEVLAVGDLDFHNKCMQKMGEIKKKGTTIIFVSHNIPDVQKICQKCLFLNDSKLICNSNTNEVVQEYYKYVSSSTDVNKEDRAPAGKTGVTLSKFVIRDAKGKQKKVFQTGEKMLIECRFLVDKPISNPILHVTFSGDTYHGYNTRDDGVQIEILDSSTEILLEINFLGLSSGIYSVCVGLWDNNYLYPYYWNWNAKILEIRSANAPLGRFVFKHNWEILHKKESQS